MSTKSALRVCSVSFFNSRPLYAGLDDPKDGPRDADGDLMFSVETALPSRCAQKLIDEEVDIALVPVAAYVENPHWEVVPGIGIGTRGAVETVVIVSDCPLEEISTLWLDTASRTSVALTKVLLNQKQLHPTLQTAQHGTGCEKVRGNDAALIIGDAAFGLEQRFAYYFDLGALWFELTRLPFVFAFWAARPGILTPEIVSALQTVKQRNLSKRAERLASEYAVELAESKSPTPTLSANHYANYLRKTIQYDLTTSEREGLVEFVAQATEIGALQSPFPAGDQRTHIKFGGTRDAAELILAREKAGNIRPARLQEEPLLEKAASGGRLTFEEGLFLYENADVMALGEAADRRRAALHPSSKVTYIIDRNVNYTNVCVTRCQFCNFYAPPGSEKGYLLSREELAKKFRETEELGGIQILLQGGLNPDLGIEYYEDLFRWSKANFKLHMHALSPTEIIHIAELEQISVRDVLIRLKAAGMDSVPGGGAEMLDDEVRARISPFKNSTEEWLDVMRQAHRLDMRSSATMVFGFQEKPSQIIAHLDHVRSLQDETGGFTAFIAWPFQAEGTRLKLRDDTSPFRYLRVQSLARLYLDNVDNIQVSWPTLGPEIGELALRFGANDFGSVMIEENVVSQAGSHFMLTAQQIEHHIRLAGFTPARRNMEYQLLDNATN